MQVNETTIFQSNLSLEVPIDSSLNQKKIRKKFRKVILTIDTSPRPGNTLSGDNAKLKGEQLAAKKITDMTDSRTDRTDMMGSNSIFSYCFSRKSRRNLATDFPQTKSSEKTRLLVSEEKITLKTEEKPSLENETIDGLDKKRLLVIKKK